MPLGLVLVVIAIFFIYLALVRPQRRKQDAQAQMWQQLEIGDEVVTAGGIYGRVTGFHEEADVLVEIAPELEVRVARRAIAAVVGPDDEEEDEAEALDGAAEPTVEEAESYPSGRQ
jgi:preprotein translocase subunit YajC